MERLRFTPVRRLALVGAALLGAPSVAGAASIEVFSGVLRVDVPQRSPSSSGNTGATVLPLPGGGAIVGLFGTINSGQLTVGSGCVQVAISNLSNFAPLGDSLPTPKLAAICDLTGVVGVRGRLLAEDHPQLWFSTLALRTKISATNPAFPNSDPPGDLIVTGPAGDTIDAGNGPDRIDAGGAPYKGQEAFPGTTGEFEDPHRNFVNAGAGDDLIHFFADGTGRDIVSGGAGIDGVTYALRFGIGFPGQTGVNVSLNDVADDGDPSIDQPDATSAGEGDNVKSDVENVTGTKREDVLTGNSSPNVLDGGEGRDTLFGLAGVDAIKAREAPGASTGVRDTISCGTPTPLLPLQSFMGRGIVSASPGDSLDFDLADVAPRDCEVLTQGAVREGPNVVVAATARRVEGRRLRVRLSCPRAAGRTCAGTLRLAARTGRGGPRAAFSIRRGGSKAVTVALPAGSTLGTRATTVRLVAVERGRHGRVTTVAFARVLA